MNGNKKGANAPFLLTKNLMKKNVRFQNGGKMILQWA